MLIKCLRKFILIKYLETTKWMKSQGVNSCRQDYSSTRNKREKGPTIYILPLEINVKRAPQFISVLQVHYHDWGYTMFSNH